MVGAFLGVTDRTGWGDERTDNLVVVDALRRRLIWVPRDVWSPVVHHRINAAYAEGGFVRLIAALWYLGLPVTHGMILNRAATERFASTLDLVVPVAEPLRFRYPLQPTKPIEEGAKTIQFNPPEERLQGERLHQWVGARYRPGLPGSDLHRIARQQTLLRVLLETGVPLSPALADPNDVRRFRDPERVFRRVDATWPMFTYGPTRGTVRPDGREVLLTPSAIDRLVARAKALVLRSPR